VDALTDDRGQALVVAVLLIGIAAVAIGGLRLAQERIFATSREHRAGEAAAEAAAAVLADAYTAELRRVAASSASPRPTPDAPRALNEPGVREGARAAASDMSERNGGPVIAEVIVRCADGSADASIVLRGRSYRAGFQAALCSRR
jgi:predicted lipid-binding transport protein (Tim44 family)